MLSAPAYDFSFNADDDWNPPQPPRLYRAASVGSWGVTSIGRGFQWSKNDDEKENRLDIPDTIPQASSKQEQEFESKTDALPRKHGHAFAEKSFLSHQPSSSSSSLLSPLSTPPSAPVISRVQSTPAYGATYLRMASPTIVAEPLSLSSRPASPLHFYKQSAVISPSSPRPRRRSSQQRVSLIAGRVSIAPIEPPSPPPILPYSLKRTDSTGSFLSIAASTRAPSPSTEEQGFLGGRSISDYEVEGDIGRGAYGLVKRGREILPDGSLGPPLVIKQVIKSRILADCWKKHPKYGTIPIEIYVMSAISNTSYVLPPRRPWDPSRLLSKDKLGSITKSPEEWVEGKDQNYYYLVLPSTMPERRSDEPPPPSDLFDLVEAYPHGLPPSSIRTYLGQIADALYFLHSQGIVHRDVKDENVVLGPDGKCILIDFGSSGLVKKSGWDTFSGTLDYAGPEILRGERYYGKEQDVWAFGVVAYVLLVGECPFMTAAEAQDGFSSPFANAAISLDERCAEGKEKEGEEEDGGGALGDAAALVRACLQVDVETRPTFEKILQCRFLAGHGGWA
ncbi:kinase-like domain-containing protein [Cyathus striatus]|nr:kinase-like domain-containing protein [Cyathus striatus]